MLKLNDIKYSVLNNNCKHAAGKLWLFLTNDGRAEIYIAKKIKQKLDTSSDDDNDFPGNNY